MFVYSDQNMEHSVIFPFRWSKEQQLRGTFRNILINTQQNH